MIASDSIHPNRRQPIVASEAVPVAHVIETLGAGGAEVLLAEVTARMDCSRFRSRVFPLEGPLDLMPRFQQAGVEVEPILRSPRKAPLPCLWRLASKLREFRPRIVHTHLYYGNVLGRIAARSAHCSRVVTTLHNPDYTFEAKPSWMFSLRKLLDRATGLGNAALLAVSEAVAEDYRRQMGWKGIRVIRNGVDCDHFRPGPVADASRLWPAGAVKILSVGRLHPQKGHRVLLQALARCRSKGVDISTVVIGEGSLRERLAQDVIQLGLSERVRFVGHQADVRAFLRAADVFAFPSIYEAVGIALLEAMACEKAVVASKVGGIVEIVEDGVSGLLVPPANADLLAEGLVRLAHSPEERARLGGSARLRVKEFDIRTTVRQLEDLYAGLMREPT